MSSKKKFSEPIVIKLQHHKTPDFKEVRGKDWVYYGEKNDYPQYLQYLYDRSVYHRALLDTKIHFVYGKGFEVDNKDITVSDEAVLNNRILRVNSFGEKLNDVLAKCVYDYELNNGFALQVIWNKAKTQAEIFNIDFANLRSNADGTKFYYTKNWIKNEYPNTKPEQEEDWKIFDAYDKDNRKGEQILYYKEVNLSDVVYPKPNYLSAIPLIETEIEVDNYNFNEVKHGFVGNTLVNFLNGVPSEAEQPVIVKKLMNQFANTDGQRVVVNFADGKEKAAEVIFLTPPESKRYDTINTTVLDKMVFAHRVPRMIAGLKEQGQLGGRTEMIEQFEFFKNIYVNNRQQVLERIFNQLLETDGRLSILNSEPISFQFSESELVKVMTQDEIREKSGLPMLEKPQKDQAQTTIDAINGLSPLVANNLLSQMTINEIRSLAGLPPIIGGDKIPEATAPVQLKKFNKESKENEIYSKLSKMGVSESDYEILHTRRKRFNSKEEVKEFEEKLRKENFAVPLDVLVSDNEAKIMSILKDDPKSQVDKIAKGLKIKEAEVVAMLDRLVDEGLILYKKNGDVKINKQGESAIDELDIEVFLKFRYTWASGFGQNDLTTSRPFCKKLMTEFKDKLYSRDEIDSLDAGDDIDVWAMRGGFWTEKGTDNTHPYCRHIWESVVVTKKNK